MWIIFTLKNKQIIFEMNSRLAGFGIVIKTIETSLNDTFKVVFPSLSLSK
jgi:hypothetical protein